MPDAELQTTLLFVDISESSKLYRALGDGQASALITSLLNHLSSIIETSRGQVVDHIGDELMAFFPQPEDAIHAAVDMQRAATGFDSSHLSEQVQLAVRIGLHAGLATFSEGRPLGQVVYRAKRVTEHAKAHQIVLDAETSHALGPSTPWPLRPMGTAELKGQDRAADLLEVTWNTAAGTAVNQSPPMRAEHYSRIVLKAAGLRYEVDEHQRASLGRLPPCDIVLSSDVVSRTHAHVIGRSQGVYLKDVSRNGCYVKQEGTVEPQYLHNGELALSGSGLIGFGRVPSPHAPHTLHYTCLPKDITP